MEGLVGLAIGLVVGLAGGIVGTWLVRRAHEKAEIERWQMKNTSHTELLRARLDASDGSLREHRERQHTQEQRLEQTRHELSECRRELAVQQSKSERIPSLEALVAERDGALSRMGEELRKSGAELAARAEQGKRIASLERELSIARGEQTRLGEEAARLIAREKELLAILNKEQEVAQEKMALLIEARDVLANQFKNLANEIFEEKTQRFTEQNKQNLDTLLNPLHEKIQSFGRLVQETYDKDSKERLTLEQELKRMQVLNTQLNQDALALTNALTGGNNKAQGTWGEMVLENILESCGLTRGREYEVQVSDTVQTEHGGIKRYQPDVVINLPENKQMVIDAKVSLTAYLRYTAAADESTREAEIKTHISSIRQHIRTLSEKRYQDLYKLNTLDFVFMFIPVEPAYLLAVQQDMGLFNEAFERRIVIVGPSTLLATLRTVANIWRYEDQNQNAIEIARQSGAMYDKFVNFAQTLERLGKQLSTAQDSYDGAMRQLMTGSGNLITRAERLRKLGVKANKQLPGHMTGKDDAEPLPELENKSADDEYEEDNHWDEGAAMDGVETRQQESSGSSDRSMHDIPLNDSLRADS